MSKGHELPAGSIGVDGKKIMRPLKTLRNARLKRGENQEQARERKVADNNRRINMRDYDPDGNPIVNLALCSREHALEHNEISSAVKRGGVLLNKMGISNIENAKWLVKILQQEENHWRRKTKFGDKASLIALIALVISFASFAANAIHDYPAQNGYIGLVILAIVIGIVLLATFGLFIYELICKLKASRAEKEGHAHSLIATQQDINAWILLGADRRDISHDALYSKVDNNIPTANQASNQ